jgi:ubiquinone/menaquinone biosynthesis C-methylase UbiE
MSYGPAGNTYNKFESTNPIARRLMSGFMESLNDLLRQVRPQAVLEVGCGEGYIQHVLADYAPQEQVAFDIDFPIVAQARAWHPASHYYVGDGEALCFPPDRFDLVMAIEVLEHTHHPARVLQEMARVSSEYVLVSVPREPIWRVLNMARGKYWGALGNTPGHIQHWSSQAFVGLLAQYFEIVQVNRPLPWTMVLCRLAEYNKN